MGVVLLLLKYLRSKQFYSGSQTTTDATWTKAQFDSENWDVGGYYDNSTNYRYTPLIAGYYMFNLVIYFSNNGAVQYERSIGSIAKNGDYGSSRVWDQDFYDASQSPYQTLNGSKMFYLNGTTDYVEAYTWCDLTSTGSPLLNLQNSLFEGFLVSAG